jgi:hypothetical protein
MRAPRPPANPPRLLSSARHTTPRRRPRARAREAAWQPSAHQACCSAPPGRRPRCAVQVEPGYLYATPTTASSTPAALRRPVGPSLPSAGAVARGCLENEKGKEARLKLRSPLLSPALAGRFDSHAVQILLRAQAQL